MPVATTARKGNAGGYQNVSAITSLSSTDLITQDMEFLVRKKNRGKNSNKVPVTSMIFLLLRDRWL